MQHWSNCSNRQGCWSFGKWMGVWPQAGYTTSSFTSSYECEEHVMSSPCSWSRPVSNTLPGGFQHYQPGFLHSISSAVCDQVHDTNLCVCA